MQAPLAPAGACGSVAPEHHLFLKAANTAVPSCRQCQHPVPIVAYGHHPLSTIWQKDRSLLQPLDVTSPLTFQVNFCFKSAQLTSALPAKAAAADLGRSLHASTPALL